VNGSGGSIGAVTLNSGTLETNDPSFIGPAIINVGDGSTLKLDTSVDLAGGIFANDRSTNGQNFTWDFGANNVSISGGVALKGNVMKLGTGDLTLNGNNTSFAGGTGIGILIINDPSTVHLSGFNPLGTSPNWENLGYNSPITLDVPIDQIIGCLRDGSGTVTKTGSGKLTVSGSSTATTGTNPAIDITAGSVQMDSVGGLGGGNQNAAPQMAITLEPGTELITNYGGGSRNSADIIFNNNTRLTMADTSPLSTDTEFSAYGSGSTNYNSSIQVNGEVTFSNQAQADTATFKSRNLQLLMPVVVNSGATLTLSAANNAGNYDKAALTFRGVDNVTNHPGDRLEIKGGGTVDATGTVGEVYFGATGRGKPIVADGGGTALFKAGTHSFFRDQGSASDSAMGSAMTKLVIAEGTNLRFEAPMNAVYNPTPEDPNNPGHAPAIRDYEGTTGLLGTNNTPSFNGSGLPSGYNNIGNGYTILSPNRASNLSLNYQPNGLPAPVVPSGMLTLAATDAGGATGTVNAGPASPSAVALALDNTATSGNLVYQIDPAANGATFQNFSKLIVTRSNTGASVTAKLLGPARIPALDVTGGAQLDIDNHALAIDYGSGNPSPIGTWDGSKYTGVTGLVQSGRNIGAWNGPGIITSQSQAQTKLTGIGIAEASEVLGLSGTATATWNGQTVDAGTVLVKYTYGGDANLDGKINIDDYGLIDSHVGQSGTAFGWHNGDFNYDGKINIDDYGIIDGNIGAQGDPFPNSALALGSASALGSVSALGGVSAVPEPTSLALIGLGAAGLLRRRRRQN
jgi:hypothetical protein